MLKCITDYANVDPESRSWFYLFSSSETLEHISNLKVSILCTRKFARIHRMRRACRQAQLEGESEIVKNSSMHIFVALIPFSFPSFLKTPSIYNKQQSLCMGGGIIIILRTAVPKGASKSIRTTKCQLLVLVLVQRRPHGCGFG